MRKDALTVDRVEFLNPVVGQPGGGGGSQHLKLRDSIKTDVYEHAQIVGQEDATIDFDEGITITPFNMKEELEEGHFTAEGMYILDKDQVRETTISHFPSFVR